MKYEKHAFNLKRRLLYLFTGKIHREEITKSTLEVQMDFLMKVRLCVTDSHYNENWNLLRSISQEDYSYYIYFLHRFGDITKAFNLLKLIDKLESESTIYGWDAVHAMPILRELIYAFDAAAPEQNSV